MIIKIFLL